VKVCEWKLPIILMVGTPDILPVPVAAQSKAYIYSHLPAEIVGSNPTGGMDACLL